MIPTLFIRSIRRIAVILMLAVAPAAGQGNGEGEIETSTDSPSDGIITTIESTPSALHVGVGPIVGGQIGGNPFRDELKGRIPEADFGSMTLMYGYGGNLRIDELAREVEFGAYGLWGSNVHDTTRTIGGVDYVRRARMEAHETVGSVAWAFHAAGASILYVGIGIGGGVYRLELYQAPRTGLGDPFVDMLFSPANPDYHDQHLTATWLVGIPHLRWQWRFSSSDHLRLQTTLGARGIFDVGPWRDREEKIRFDLPRNSSIGAFGSIMLSIGFF